MLEHDIFSLIPKEQYEISSVLARGAFGTVYRGRQKATGRHVVLKFLYLPNTEALARIDREISVLKAIPDSHYVTPFLEGYLSSDAKSAVLISEWIDGLSLQSMIEKYGRGLPANVIVSIGRQLCEGLAHLHKCNIMHRDIKPSNILISKDGIVKIVDFGIAISSAEEIVRTEITTVGSFVGTLRYAAPEMVMGQQFSTASDIYAAGVTILFMILGRPPLQDATVPYLLQGKFKGTVLSELSDSQQSTWGVILSDTLDPQPQQRPSAVQLYSMLSKVLPPTLDGDAIIVTEFMCEVGDLGSQLTQPLRNVTSGSVPESDGSLLNLIRKLASRIDKINSVVNDLTASFNHGELQQDLSEFPNAIGLETGVEATFKAIQNRLSFTWRFSIVMTIILFSIFVIMIVFAIVFGLIYQKSFWGILFGGTSVVSLLTVVVWRPMDKMLFITIATQHLELIQINCKRALSGTREERREAFRDVSAQLDSLIEKVTSYSKTK